MNVEQCAAVINLSELHSAIYLGLWNLRDKKENKKKVFFLGLCLYFFTSK